MFIILGTINKDISRGIYTHKSCYCISAVFLARKIKVCITQELRAFSKFGVDVVVMRIPASEFLLRSIAKLPAKNFASSTEVVENIYISSIVCTMTSFLPLGNDINYHDTWIE
jgi:hypothetical protein